MLAALTLEIGLLCRLYTGDLPFLQRAEELVFRFLLQEFQEVDSAQAILEPQPDSQGWSLRRLQEARPGPEEDWTRVEILESPELFDEDEPSPSEMALILSKLHQAGVRDLALTAYLSWSQAEQLELLALESSLQPFETVLLPVAASEVPQPDDSPLWLADSLLSRENLRGDTSGLPLLNQVVAPPSLEVNPRIRFAFPDFGSRDFQYRREGRVPLLARWHEGFLPSWPLALAMRLEGVSAADLVIEPGRHLRLGADGPVIPLDDFGRARMEGNQPGAKEWPSIKARELFPLGEVDLPQLTRRVVVLEKLDERRAARSEELLAEARALLSFPRPGPQQVFARIGWQWEVFLFAEVLLVALYALFLRPWGQFLALAGLCLLFVASAGGLFLWQGLWTPVFPFVIATTVAWCLVGYLQQIAHPLPQKRKAPSQS
ncbi:hypothetical protein [Roseibacillus ishigakijimensis]|uniref:hypothetical protein n=1 Tax=Roseibacillus ishigakijimensis TaxID=454146 RepID=UPI00366D23DF